MRDVWRIDISFIPIVRFLYFFYLVLIRFVSLCVIHTYTSRVALFFYWAELFSACRMEIMGMGCLGFTVSFMDLGGEDQNGCGLVGGGLFQIRRASKGRFSPV